MADSNSPLSSGKRAVPDLVPPSVTNNGRLQTVHTPAPGSLQESPAKGSNSSSKEAVKDQKEETESPINFWGYGSQLYRHPPPVNPFPGVSEHEWEWCYYDPLEWMKPDDDDYVEVWPFLGTADDED